MRAGFCLIMIFAVHLSFGHDSQNSTFTAGKRGDEIKVEYYKCRAVCVKGVWGEEILQSSNGNGSTVSNALKQSCSECKRLKQGKGFYETIRVSGCFEMPSGKRIRITASDLAAIPDSCVEYSEFPNN